MASNGRSGAARARWSILLVLALALAPWTPAAAATHPHQRQGWLVGFGIGGGTAGIDVAGASSSREGGVAGSLRVGYAFSEQVSLELDGSLWSKEQGGTTVTFSATGATLNYYPGETGMVLRAGVGVGTGEASLRSGNVIYKATENGLGVLGGVSYEFRVTPRFALGPQIHAGWINLDSFNADWINFELGFHWYLFRR